MGFDNECISSIQSLPGEYFCPICRTLIYPNEALQTQCTHLYCKPCLAYVVATTKACPYDGYLVTEADSKPLMESNKTLAETIGKVTVHCLYHKSGCQWHGTLSACITHGTTCAYGNSPVICNCCGAQIVHRQVQEHAKLCNGVQSQTQQTDGTQVQPVVATQAVAHDPSLASAGSAAGTATTLPSTTATAVTDSASATGGAAGATTASTTLPPFSATSGSASQTPTAEQCYQQQQLQYSQYYQQQHPGCNPYMQQYQQYGQYQHVYQQYLQPPLQVPSQKMMQGSAQPATYVQPQVQDSQPQYMMQSQPKRQTHLQLPAGQPQTHQSIQPAPQVPQLQTQSQVPLLLSRPQVQPAAHTPVGNRQFAITSTQAKTPHVQPHVQVQPAQQQLGHLQALPPQQNLQPQMQLNTQTQLETPQAQQQSYPQPQAYAQQAHHMHSQNASYPQQQIPHGALLQQPVHAPLQEAPVLQHLPPMRPPLPGQQPVMLPPQGIQQTTQNQQHIGYHAQWPLMQSNIAYQAPQQGLPRQSSVSSQPVQPYQQGTPLSQQQVLSQPGPPNTQQHIPGNTGHVQTSSVGPASHLAPPQQFQHQQQTTFGTQSSTVGQPFGQGSLDLETRDSKSRKSENASSAADNTVSKNKNYCAARIRVGSWNVGSLTGELRELVDVATRRRVNILCVQETKWKDQKAMEVDNNTGFKLWYTGTAVNGNGVGVLIDKSLKDGVVDVRRQGDSFILVRLVVGDMVLNVISVHAPQVGHDESAKRQFWEDLDSLVRTVPSSEKLIIGGDLNGCVGTARAGFEAVHGGFGYGSRNQEGEEVLNFAVAFDLMIANTFFRKRQSHLVTFSGGQHYSHNLFLTRRKHKQACLDCKVIPGECVVSQHKLVVVDFRFQIRARRDKQAKIARTKWWKLKEKTSEVLKERVIKEGPWKE